MNIASVMVTFNRLNELKKTIETYENQTVLPTIMIIVDNCSTDGTREFLEEWKKQTAPFEKVIIHLPANVGGSGGFYTGIEYALTTSADWYWIADDDAYLDAHAFEEIEKFACAYPDLVSRASALCSSVRATEENPEIIKEHRRRITSMAKQTLVAEQEYLNEFFEVNLFTFVGGLIKADAVKKIGLPNKDVFIYYDDLEYSFRLNKWGPMFCITGSTVFHYTAPRNDTYGYTWRSFYQSRNSLYFLKMHFKLIYLRVLAKRYIQRYVFRLFGKYSQANQLDWDAAMDVKKNKLGISEKYYIGWRAHE